jgi:LysR family transcriptional regulator, glycine cleavage system transcriptional activator
MQPDIDKRVIFSNALAILQYLAMRKLPPLNALRSFEAAGRLSSLTLAADALNVTQSAIAQQIRVLEAFLGQKLFERDGRSVRLTLRGRHYWTDVSLCLGRLADATEHMLDATTRRPIRVNASTSFVHTWLLPQLAHFRQQHPDVEIEVVATPDQNVASLDETSDVMIRRYSPELRRQDFVSKPLLRNVAVAVCTPGHPSLARLRTPADLLHAPLLHYAGMPRAWQYWFHSAEVPVGETLRGPFFDEFLLTLRAATSGHGICLAPRAVIHEELTQGRLIALFDEEVHLEGPPYHCLYRSADDDMRLTTFVQWLLRHAEELDGPPLPPA